MGEGRLVEAESEFRAAVRAFPAFPEAHGDLGVALARRGELSAAEAAFRLAVRFGPARAVAYLNLATCLLQQGRHAETEEWARQAAHLDPAGAESHRLVGCALEARGNFAGAETAFRDAARLDPNLADAHWRLGGLLVRRERPQEAEAAYREAVRLKPDHAGAWVALGNLLEAEGRAPEAADCCRRAVQLDPGSAELHNCLGVALAGADRPEEAEAAYREALRLDPNMVTAHSNLGNTLRALDRLDEAEAALRGALRLKADYPEAHNNLGIVLVQQGRTDEGLGCYEEALRLRPEYPEARLNRSLSWLGAGDFARGWPEYEWRWKMRHIKPPPATAPRWDGGPVGGRSVLVLSEQGLGDTIHFVRYARALAARGATVLVDCPEPLAGVVATCPGVDRAVARGTAVPAHDLSVPLLSLPGLLGVPPDAPVAPVPYVRPAPGRADHWRAELAGAPGFRVGIAWQGSKVHRGDRLRSVPLTRFAALAAVPGVRLFSLQKGPGSEQLTGAEAAGMGVVDLGGRTDPDMGDVGALMTALDLVVTVDTALAHLAGALGLPVWVAVPYAADWRWLQGREDTIWYPTMRLFRQPRRGDWDAVFARLAAELAPLVAARAGTEGAGA
ncbi:lipoprotein NlpI [Gemmata sp. SH-PL17]|nr:lipoprotein NlpI [Gemmata sp. SH-PL17]